MKLFEQQTPLSTYVIILPIDLRLPIYIGTVMNFFSFLYLFKHTLCNNVNFKQAVGPGVLQTFSTCAVIKALFKKN